MQAKLCGLVAMDAYRLETKAMNRPGKAQKRLVVTLMPEKALVGRRSVHSAAFNV